MKWDRRCSLVLLAGLTCLAIGQVAAAQVVPLGSEFRVNSYTTGSQTRPFAASAADGRFVVVWSSDGDVFAQRYDSAGSPSGPEFQVNSYTSNSQYVHSVASAADGRFVVVWHSTYGQDGDFFGVFAQRYDSVGNRVGPEFQVNSYTTSFQYFPSVASAADGRFVVVWSSTGQDGDGSGVFAQRYDSAGSPSGPEFRVNSYTTREQAYPSVASADDGSFVVVWQSYGQDGDFLGVFGQRYNSAGSPSGPEFQVNSYTTGRQRAPSVASAADGRFVVAWQSFQDGSPRGVFAQRYDSAGTPVGPEFQVNSYTTGDQGFVLSVAAAADGRFVVVWQSGGQDGSGYGVFAQRYDSAGSPSGPEFQVNSYTTGDESRPRVASAADGRFVVVWEGGGYIAQDGSGYGVFGQRFADDLIFKNGFE